MSKYNTYPDPELVALLKTGSRAAFETIYRRYAADLFRYARKNISSTEDCEEMIQDVFESLWLRHDTLNIQSLRHYLFSSIRYMIIRHINHRGVQRRYLEYYKVFADIYDTTPDDLRNQQELQQRILQCLFTLPERCRHAVHLRLIDDLSNAEIAQRMNISKGTVELYMCKALAHLRKVFSQSKVDIIY